MAAWRRWKERQNEEVKSKDRIGNRNSEEDRKYPCFCFCSCSCSCPLLQLLPPPMKESPFQLHDLTPVSVIGYGKFSTVVRANTRRCNYAVKITPKTNTAEQLSKITPSSTTPTTVPNYQVELEILRRITPYNHPNIVHTETVFISYNMIYIVQELSIQGELTPTYFKSNNHVLSDMLSAIQFIHSLNIVHRDIKPANFLVFSSSVKLTDFDTCYTLTNNNKQDYTALYSKPIGTPIFLPPELIHPSSASASASSPASSSPFSTLRRKLRIRHQPTFYPFALDMWSLGATLYYLLYTTYPFHANNEFALQHEIATQTPHFPTVPSSTDLPLLQVIKSLLVKDPASRSTLTNVLHSLHITLPPVPENNSTLPLPLIDVGDTDLPAVDTDVPSQQLRIELPIFDSTESLPSPSSGSLKHSGKMNFRKFHRKNSNSTNIQTVNDYLDNL